MFKSISKIVLSAVFVVVIAQSGCTATSPSAPQAVDVAPPPKIQKSLSENLVEFIFQVVGKKSKKIDESLVRDEV